MKSSLLLLLVVFSLYGCGNQVVQSPKDEHGHEEAGHVDSEVKLSPEAEKLAGVKTFMAIV